MPMAWNGLDVVRACAPAGPRDACIAGRAPYSHHEGGDIGAHRICSGASRVEHVEGAVRNLLQSVADGGVLRLRVVATMSARLAMAHRGACLAWRSGVACARARVFRRRLGSLARTRLVRRISRQCVCHTDVGTWRIARLTPRACLVRELVHGIGAPSAGWRGTCSTWYVVVRFGILGSFA